MIKTKKYKGIVVPVVTPLTEDHKLDHGAVERIFGHLYKYEAEPFILGTTGESASLPNTVKQDYLKKAAQLKLPGTLLYAGISSNSLGESVELAKRSFDAGADAVAATLPSYYRLSEGQMTKYFEQLADRVKGPVIIYNIPATVHMSIPLHLVDNLSRHEYIVGIKDSERNETRLDESLRLWKDREDFSHFLGWAGRSAYALIHGSDGLIPSTGNLHPALYYEMKQSVGNGDMERAYHYQRQSDLLGDLYQAGRTLGESLWALKVLMNEYRLCRPHMMPPLHPLPAEEEQKLIEALRDLIIKEKIELNVPLSHV